MGKANDTNILLTLHEPSPYPPTVPHYQPFPTTTVATPPLPTAPLCSLRSTLFPPLLVPTTTDGTVTTHAWKDALSHAGVTVDRDMPLDRGKNAKHHMFIAMVDDDG